MKKQVVQVHKFKTIIEANEFMARKTANEIISVTPMENNGWISFIVVSRDEIEVKL